MTLSRWISLTLIAALVIGDVVVLSPAYHAQVGANAGHFPGQDSGALLAAVAFAAIWWPDMAGAVFLMARYGPLPDWLAAIVKGLGWVLLAGVVVVRVCFIHDLWTH